MEQTPTTDQPVFGHINRLVEEEHELFERSKKGEMDSQRLASVQVELDRCWDLLRQRRALRGVGLNPELAQVRPAQVVENYEQ